MSAQDMPKGKEQVPAKLYITREELTKLAIARKQAYEAVKDHSKRHPVSRNVALGALLELLQAVSDISFEKPRVRKKKVELPAAEEVERLLEKRRLPEDKSARIKAVARKCGIEIPSVVFPKMPSEIDPDFKYDPSEVVYGTDVADGKETVIGVVMRDDIIHLVSETTAPASSTEPAADMTQEISNSQEEGGRHE